MALTRRNFLKTASAGLSALLVPPALFGARSARAAGTDPVLVSFFLRGGADTLNLVVPHGDPRYYQLRPVIQVPPGSQLDLDGFFGLHPFLSPLLPFYQSGKLAVIHASGSPQNTRSHFDAQDFMEFGAPGDKTVRVGWLNRYVAAAGITDLVAAVSVQGRAAKALDGPAANLAVPSVVDFKLTGSRLTERRAALDAIYSAAQNALFGRVVQNAFGTVDRLSTVSTATSVMYPVSALGARLRDLAALIKADIGVRVAAVELHGWDHHSDENFRLPASAGEFASGLAAFATDLGADLDRTLVLVMTEFGRKAGENGAGGCDHGHGAAMFVLGGGIAGGRVLLRDDVWPGLQQHQLYEGRDLAVTTDFRDVFAEALHRHMGLANLGTIFPNYTPNESQYPGLYV